MKNIIIILLLSFLGVSCQQKNGGGVSTDILNPIDNTTEWFAKNAAVTEATTDATIISSASSELEFNLSFSKAATVENCTPTVPVMIGGNTYNATYDSGSGTKALKFKITIPAGVNDNDGIEILSPISADEGCLYDTTSESRQPAVLTFEDKKIEDLVIDQSGPLLKNFEVTPSSQMIETQSITIKINVDEETVKKGNSSLPFTLGGNSRTATYVSGAKSKQLIYSYTTTSADKFSSGLTINSLPSNLFDSAGNPIRGPSSNYSSNLYVARYNSAPVASNQTVSAINEDSPGTITLNYTDAENDPSTACAISSLSNITITSACTCTSGICSVQVQGSSNFSGNASFKYTVSGAGLTSNLATITVPITQIDDAPLATGVTGSNSLEEDTPKTFTLGYSDVENHKASSCSISSVSGLLASPSCSCNGSGVCTTTLTPQLGYSGPASLTYTITANGLTSSSHTSSLVITGVDDPPVVTSIVMPSSINEDIIASVQLDYSDPEGDQATSCSILSVTNLLPAPTCSCSSGVCSASIRGTTNFSGSASFTFRVTANGLNSNTETAIVYVVPVDDAPVASGSGSPVQFNEDTATSLTLNYTDIENDKASACNIISISNLQPGATCSCNGSGVCTTNVTGVSNYVGNASVTYTVTSNGKTSSSATASFTILNVDDAPVASTIVNPSTLTEDTSKVITLNYSDVDNDKATSCTITAVSNLLASPSCSCNGSGICTTTLQGTASYNGPASVSYYVTANGVNSNTVTANLNISNVDNPPVATGSASPSSINEDSTTSVTLAYTDTDNDLATSCTVTAVSNLLSSPSCSCNGSGVCTASIRGNSNYFGSATISYKVVTNGLESNVNTANLTINNVDDAPVLSTIISPSSINEDTLANITLSYTDIEGDKASSCNLTGSSNLAPGSSCSCDGAGVCRISLQGAANFVGTANLSFTVTSNGLTSNQVTTNLTINNIDDAPSANGVISPNSISENTATQITLGYTDIENDKATSCSILSVTNLNNSPSCSCDGAGICRTTVTGTTNYNGPASFTYRVTANGQNSNTATANLTVTNVDNAPVASPSVSPLNFNEDTSTQITLSYTDADGDLATACAVTSVTNLQPSPACSCNAGSCKATVIGTANYNGAASFSYRVTANGLQSNIATVNLTINPVDDAPVASGTISPNSISEDILTTVTLNYTDLENNQASACAITAVSNLVSSPSCTCSSGICTAQIQGTNNYNGAASLTYTVTANGLTSAAQTANLTINPVDDAPVANGASVSPLSFNEDISTSITLNYSDVDYVPGDTVSCTISGQTNLTTGSCLCSLGTCTVNAQGSSNYYGPASFQYRVTVGLLQSNLTTANFTINNVDDAPVAGPSVTPNSFNEDTAQLLTLAYSDLEGNQASACTITSVTNLNASPSCSCSGGVCTTTVQGVNNYSGSASLSYRVTANGLNSNTFTANVTINPVDDAPVAANINPPGFNQDTQSIITLSYSDIESNQASSCALYSLSNVTVTQSCACSAGVCTVGVTGAPGYSGSASFNYTVTANTLSSNLATANLTINSVNTNPTLSVISNMTTNYNIAIGPVPFSITDAENALACNTTYLTVSSSNTSVINSGSFSFGGSAPNCNMTITPVADASGTSNITLTVGDGVGGSASRNFTITVNPGIVTLVWMNSTETTTFTSVDMGNCGRNQSLSATYKLKNTGNANSSTINIAFNPIDTNFNQSHTTTCGASLAPNSSCTITVYFAGGSSNGQGSTGLKTMTATATSGTTTKTLTITATRN